MRQRRKFSAMSATASPSAAVTLAPSTASSDSPGLWPVLEQGSDAGSSGGSSSVAEVDSMRPVAPPARKRRRTILDAFNSISLNHTGKRASQQASSHNNSNIEGEETEDCGDADSSQAVADNVQESNDDITTSSIEDDDGDDDEGKFCLLSDKEEAERNVMFELVLGPAMLPRKVNPVDVKIDKLVRGSRFRLALAAAAAGITGNHTVTQDDARIDPPYARPHASSNTSSSSMFGSSGGSMFTRSNSLPDLSMLAATPSSHEVEMKDAATTKTDMEEDDDDDMATEAIPDDATPLGPVDWL